MSESQAMTAQPAVARAALYCPDCGYDLRGLTGDSCPECGNEVSMENLERWQIPWAQRSERGRFKTFWRTVWQVTRRPERFVQAAAMPVAYRDARKFHLTLVLWTWLWLVCMFVPCLVALYASAPSDISESVLIFSIVSSVEMCMLCGFLFTATALHTYWLHPRGLPVEQQNRAVAIGYYAAAPLAFLPVAPVVYFAGFMLGAIGDEIGQAALEMTGVVVAIASVGVLLAVPLKIWLVVTLFARRVARLSGASLWSLIIGLPVLWAVLAVVWFVLIAGACGWAVLMLCTL